MKKIIITIIIATQIYFYDSYSQGVWTQKADFGGVGRYSAAGFSIGTKGYIGTGRDSSFPYNDRKDFWEYDPSIDSWSQKADFAGAARNGAVGFSIGNKGYIGTGNDSLGKNDDFWEYDPVNNSWKQIADYPGGAVWGAVSFVIGSKAYMGMGWDSSWYGRKDFWEYDPSIDSWSQIASCPGPGGGPAAGFSIGGKGYVGTGNDSAQNYPSNQFWEYDPAVNNWTRKADFPGLRCGASGFSIGSYGYIGLGVDTPWVESQKFWKYDPANDLWISQADFGGAGRLSAVVFTIGNKGYSGTGTWALKDFWEFTPEGSGIVENEMAAKVTVFPNPSSDFITVFFKPQTKNPSFEIIDILGKTIFNFKFQISDSEYKFNISDLPQGVYLLKIKDGEMNFLSKFVKN